jgi:frataxin
MYSDLSTGEYHKVADHTLEEILEVLETIGDERDIDGFDVEYSVSSCMSLTYELNWFLTLQQQGVLTLKLGSKGTYVLNKQPPNKQIWLSSPRR